MNIRSLLCIVIFWVSSECLKIQHPLKQRYGLPAIIPKTNQPSLRLITEENEKIEASSNGRNVSIRNLVQEVGSNAKQLIEETIYNETRNMKMCWKTILYVNDSNGETTSWQEYQVIFDFPAEDDQSDNEIRKSYRQYAIQMDEAYDGPYDFEVVKEHPSYTVSKHENITCGSGKFLAKTYYEWPRADKKKIVLRLTDEHLGLAHDSNPNVDGDILGSPNNASNDTIFDNDDAKSLGGNTDQNKGNVMQKSGPISANSSESFNGQSGDHLTLPNIDIERNISSSMPSLSSDEVPPSGKACSPILTLLLSGNGLCNLNKDEKVLLQGEITISRKYFNEIDQKEIVEPMYVIHENSEIETNSEIPKGFE